MTGKLPTISSNSEAVVISIPKDEFGSFINDLLKTKRSISRSFDHYFNIEKGHIADILSIVDFRVKEQSTANLLSCEIISHFSDGSKRRYDNLETFLTLNDYMSAHSNSVIVNLAYLVQFSQENPPAKQEIAFIANSGRTFRSNDMFGLIPVTIFGEIDVEIKSNSFTWADEIIGHISKYLDSKFAKPGFLLDS